MKTRHVVATTILAVGAILLTACSSTTTPSPSVSPAPSAPTASALTAPATPTTASATPETGDSALMTVYRKKRIVGLALHTSVYVDGTEIAELGNGTFVKVKVAPGQHRVWADEERDAIMVGFETGKTYYFRMELVPGMWKGNGRMVAVDETTGKKEFADYHPKPAGDIKVPAMVVVQ
jgi:hypothetical protein